MLSIALNVLALLAAMNLQVPSPAPAIPLQPTTSGIFQLTFAVPNLGEMRYAILIPRGYRQGEARPLVLALHPGGDRTPYYGGAFVRQIVAPALADLGAIMVAPDCPTRAWSDPDADRAVMALLDSILHDYTIDRSRVLVTGFSLGGRGTWFMESHHADLFTAAIVMAGAPGDEPLDRLARMPTYVIHSRDDEVMPFAPSEKVARELKRLGRDIVFQDLYGVGHYQMGGYVDSLKRAGHWVQERWSRRPA